MMFSSQVSFQRLKQNQHSQAENPIKATKIKVENNQTFIGFVPHICKSSLK